MFFVFLALVEMIGIFLSESLDVLYSKFSVVTCHSFQEKIEVKISMLKFVNFHPSDSFIFSENIKNLLSLFLFVILVCLFCLFLGFFFLFCFEHRSWITFYMMWHRWLSKVENKFVS